MTKYHVRGDGTVGICTAKLSCPFGADDVHFQNRVDAEKHARVVCEKLHSGPLFEPHQDIYTYPLKRELSGLEASLRGEWVEGKMKEAIGMGLTSSALHKGKLGLWTKERSMTHERILDQLMEDYKDVPSEGKVIMSAGQGGAGKTTCLRDYMNLPLGDYATVSSDDFKEILAKEGLIPEVEGCSPMERSTLVHEESSYLADRLLNRLSREKKNVIYDFTCKKEESTMTRLNLLRDNGYREQDIQFVFVDISNDIAKERAKSRYLRGLNSEKYGGRFLPESVIEANKPKRGLGYRSVNAETLVGIVNEGGLDIPTPIIFDNSGDAPVRIPFNDFVKG